MAETSSTSSVASFALLLYGRHGSLRESASAIIRANRDALEHTEYARPIATCATSHLRFIIHANTAGVDIFAHSWNPEVASFFNKSYASHLRASLHEPLMFRDKARSQALSIGRSALLMRHHEKIRGLPYTLCFVLRSDALIGAPIDLSSFDPSFIWFAEHCCLNDATDEETKALVRSRCGIQPRAVKDMGMRAYRKRVLGACRVSQFGGRYGSHSGQDWLLEDYSYFLMDWWFIATPTVAASWLQISDSWHYYRRRMQHLRISYFMAHYTWAFHVNDALNRSASVRFWPGMRLNLVRYSYSRLKMRASDRAPLGEYITDAIGNCDTLLTLDNRTLSSRTLMEVPVTQNSMLGQHFKASMVHMAEQCAVARLERHDRVICCGEPAGRRRCGLHKCATV